MVALAREKVDKLQARGYENASLYDPPGVGGTHMMYVVPHGDRLADYQLPEDPTASPGALAVLTTLKKVGASLLSLGVIGAALHYLAVGPQSPDEETGARADDRGHESPS